MGEVRGRLRGRRGFTLAELLLVIAILAILGVLGAGAALRTQKSMERLKLDRIAENLYHTAQNQLSQRSLMYGNTSMIAPVADEVLLYCYDLREGSTERQLYCVASDSKLASRILPNSGYGTDGRGSWIVEYEPKSYTVFSVFYSERSINELESSYLNEALNHDLRRNEAIRSNRGIGYYEGSMPGEIEKRVGRLELSVEIDNGEKLIAYVHCESENASLFGTSTAGLTVEVEGRTSGNRWSRTIPARAVGSGFTEPIVLDSLKSGESFREQLGGAGGARWIWMPVEMSGPLLPGEQITVRVKSTSPENAFFEAEASAEANSLFADTSKLAGSAYTADIACGRHLQNLDTAASGFPTALGTGIVVDARQTAGINFGNRNVRTKSEKSRTDESGDTLEYLDWLEFYPDRTFTPIHNDALRSFDGNFCPIRYLTVDESGNAGLFASFDGALLKRIVLEDPVVQGTGNVGGLAGTITDAATVDSCRVYMSKARIDEEKAAGRRTAELTDWMTGFGSAGGLVGVAQGALTIQNSFAATVVKGGDVSGGLVGSAQTLTVERSYADCYLDAPTLGGLAGSCVNECTFTHCYSAGFVLVPDAAKVTAGFVPSSAVVRHCYSVFCFDDPMIAEARTVGERLVNFPAGAPADMTMWALASGGTAEDAYYTYGGAKKAGSEVCLSADELSGRTIEGFTKAGEGTAANSYGLLGDGLRVPTTWTYPMLALPHHNDYFNVPESEISLVSVVITHTAEEARVEQTLEQESPVPSGGIVYAQSSPRFSLGQVFVGWFDEDALENLRGDPCAWARTIDRKNIHTSYWWYVESGGARLAKVNGANALSSEIPGNPMRDNEKITLSSKARETKTLYAVYREVQPYTVSIWFTRFVKDKFSVGVDEYANTPTAENYLNGGRVESPLIYMVDPILERGDAQFSESRTHTFRFKLGGSDGTTSEYKAITPGGIEETYGIKDVAPFWGFDESFAALSAADMAAMSLSGGAEEDYELTVRVDKPYTYGVLFDAKLVGFFATFHFDRIDPGMGEYKQGSGVSDRVEALRSDIAARPYNSDYRCRYDAKVAMGYPHNVTVWPDVTALHFDGFTLERAERTIITDESITPGKEPEVWFTRSQYMLSFNLDGGVYYKEPGGSGEQVTESYIEPKPLYYNEALALFPEKKNENEAGVQRANHTLLYWEVYPAALDPEEAKKQTIRVKADGSATRFVPGKDGAEDTWAACSAAMPPYDAVAKAVWKKDVNAKVRLELYVQDVLDDKDAADGARNYALYNTYYINEKTDVNAYYSVSSDTELLRAVYNGSKAANGGVPKTAVPEGNDVHRYFSVNSSGEAAICPQLTLDKSVTDKDGKERSSILRDGVAHYELDEDGAAVFRLFYRRNRITFRFEYYAEYEKSWGNWHGKGELLKPAPFTGLYEAPFSHYTDENGEPYKWPGDGSLYWTAYAAADGGREQIGDSKLSFLNSFYYDSWIEGAQKSSSELIFVGNKTDADYSVSFYLERIGDGNPRDAELRALVNQSTGAADFSDAMDANVMQENKGLFSAQADFVEWFDSDKPAFWFIKTDGDDSSALLFTPNDKYSGYTMDYFVTDLEEAKYSALGLFKVWSFKEGKYKDIFQSWYAVRKSVKNGTFRYENSGVVDNSGTAIRFAPSLKMYNTRNVYRVYFNNVRWNGESQFVDAYLYGAPLDSLPTPTSKYCPYGSEYEFVGWNTHSDASGDWWVLNGGLDRTFTAGPYVGSAWKQGSGVLAAASPDANTGKALTMPANNLSVYAIWRRSNVEVNCYTMLTTSGGSVTGVAGPGSGGKYAYGTPALTFQTQQGECIDEQLAALRVGFGLKEYSAYKNRYREVLKVGDKYYRFMGWYRASDSEISSGADPKTLTQRFSESDYVVVHGGDALNLVARWEQVGGLRGYTVRCELYDDRSNLTLPEDNILTVTNRECGYPDAPAGEPLTVRPPTGEGAKQGDKLYRLQQYSPEEPNQSVNSLDDEHSTFTFHYFPGTLWSYQVNYCLNVNGRAVIIEREEEGKTYYYRYVVYPRAALAGYVLDDKSTSVALQRPADGTTQTANFFYTLAPNAIQPLKKAAVWDLSAARPDLLTVNTKDGTLHCYNTDLKIVTTVKLGDTVVEERVATGGSGTVTMYQPTAPGRYPLRVEVTVVDTVSGSVVGTLYSGGTATVSVLYGSLTFRYGDKAIEARLDEDGKLRKASDDSIIAASALASELNENASATFLGFYDGEGAGAKLVFDASGALQGDLPVSATLYAKFSN